MIAKFAQGDRLRVHPTFVAPHPKIPLPKAGEGLQSGSPSPFLGEGVGG
ncbi:MAG: hypothetical protein HC879_01855 [Leptolyngbyaceae cyanobacterium SL_5_9]|nr:hypothetical protein [Leptolyngbyaceae cyanobacterium SL_5_9]